jgi:hypothetical protein
LEAGLGREPQDWSGQDEGRPQDFTPRWAVPPELADGPAFRFDAGNGGWMEVSAAQTAAWTGASTGLHLRVFHRGRELPVDTVSAPDGRPAAYRFLALPFDAGLAEPESPHWLVFAPAPGPALATEARPPTPGLPEARAHTAFARIDRDRYFLPLYRPWDTTLDHWFVESVSSLQERLFAFTTPHARPEGMARLWLRAGDKDAATGNPPSRLIDLRAGGTLLGSATLKGQGTNFVSVTFAASALADGITSLGLRTRPAGTAPVVAYAQELVLEYPATLRAVSNRCDISRGPGLENLVVDGFTTPDLLVLDATDPHAPVRLTEGAIASSNGTFAVRFRHASREGRRYLLHAGAPAVPAATARDLSGTRALVHSAPAADWVVITPRPHSPALARLAAHRAAQGLPPRVVDVRDVFDAFGHGVRDPAALRQYLGFLRHHSPRPGPRFVVLVGDASYDPRGRTGGGGVDDLPTFFGPGPYEWGAWDARLAVVEGADTVPDLPLGRLPTADESALDALVNKIIAFETAPAGAAWRNRATLIADRADPAGNFPARSEALRAEFFGRLTVTTGYRDFDADATVRARALAAFADGTRIVQYLGHGFSGKWADIPGGNLFTQADAAGLTNPVFPLVAAFACQNGQFAGSPSPSAVECLAESLLEQPRGAVAVIAAASQAGEAASATWAHGFWRALLTERRYRLGEALPEAWSAVAALGPQTAELGMYTLLGDPALVVHPVAHPHADSDGDGLPDGWEAEHGTQPFRADAQADTDGDGLSQAEEYARGGHPWRADTDGDGLPDAVEARQGLRLDHPDRDGDGLPDGWELRFGLDPHLPDAHRDDDQDGLDHAAEWAAGTHPGRADSDGDGWTDGEERAAGWDPRDPFHPLPRGLDADGDGLDAAAERRAGTDPQRLDTDGDGLSDGDEARAWGTDPRRLDTDSDGLSDGVETARGTDPLRADSDADGLPDAWEMAHDLDPLRADGHEDADGDSLTQLEEWFLGSHPRQPDTDGDGLPDGDEVRRHGTDPLRADSDGDGLTDGAEVWVHGTLPGIKDSDVDGLSDAQEISAGTDPLHPDTDRDGLPDGWEVPRSLNPLTKDADLDPDGDGLSSLREYGLGTHPTRADTDFDTLADGVEVDLHGTHPLRYDTDFDGAFDGQEIAAGTDPLRPDSDGDGMSDGYELLFGLDPLRDDAGEDPDGDGLTNRQESQHYTHPFRADTDSDGLSDLFEVLHGHIPRVADRDRDGLTDGDEVLLHGTNPSLADSDSDGLSDSHELFLSLTDPLRSDSDGDGAGDGVEWQAGLAPLTDDLHLDPDGDGLPHGAELAAGTLPFHPDTDADGLNDGAEIARGTDPRRADTDGDGLADGLEISRGTHPLLPDTDGDGLPDAWEIAHGTDPLQPDGSADPDGDGVPNRLEHRLGSSPLLADTDGDGLDDLREFLLGTDPAQADPDGDGLADAEETALGTDPRRADAHEDPDGDGLTHAQEWALGTPTWRADADADGHPDGWEVEAGTDPHDPRSVLRLFVQPIAGGLRLRWISQPGRVYHVYRQAEAGGPILPWQTPVPATPPANTLMLPADGPGVYHLRVEGPTP